MSMIVLVLGDEEGQQVLDRLLSPTLQQHACACHQSQQAAPPPAAPAPVPPKPACRAGKIWSDDENAAIAGCSSPNEALFAYRSAFPDSDRTRKAIKRQLYALKTAEDERVEEMLEEMSAKDPELTPEMWDRRQAEESDAIAADLRDECSAEQIEDEIEATGEPAGPVDSEIAAEMKEDVPDDLSRLDPTLAGLRDEDTPTPCECPEEEAPPSADPEKKPRTRKDAWLPREDAAIVDAPTDVAAIAAYRKTVPEGLRTDLAIKSRWRSLLKQPRVGKMVRIINLSSSAMNGKTGTIRKILDSGDCLVSVRGSPEQIWCSPDKLTVISGGSA